MPMQITVLCLTARKKLCYSVILKDRKGYHIIPVGYNETNVFCPSF